MSQKTHKYESSKGNKYEIHGSNASGYRAKNDEGKRSSYATDDISTMERHIENVEAGKTSDNPNFSKK